jgi:hypothetical protein
VQRDVYIWGTGQVGRAARRLLDRRVVGFVDNDARRWNQEVDGLPVVSPAEILNASNRAFVVIASMYEDAITKQLCAANWTPGADFAPIASVVEPGTDSPADVFTRIFESNTWSDTESRSGGGSSIGATAPIRAALPALLTRYSIRTVVDAPCGDLRWMVTMLSHIEDYTGVEVVPQLVASNQKRYGSRLVRFVECDLSNEPPPSADLVICRDCLVHLPTPLALRALRNIAATRSRYLLTTTFPLTTVNREVLIGAWRPLNLQRAPFLLGAPLESIAEYPEYEEGSDEPFADKTLALWALDDVRAALE